VLAGCFPPTFARQALPNTAPALEHWGLAASLAHALLHVLLMVLLELVTPLVPLLASVSAVPLTDGPLFTVLTNAALHSRAQAAPVRAPHAHRGVCLAHCKKAGVPGAGGQLC
jgi:hypothetical protein